MNALKAPCGQWWLGWAGPEASDSGAAGLADDSAEAAADASAADAARRPRKRTHSSKRGPNCWWLGLRRLCQVSAPYVCARLVLQHKKSQVCPQLLKFLLLVAFRVPVGVGFVQRAPLGRSVASSTFLALHLPPFGMTLLRQLRAVALEGAVGLALVALISAIRSRSHRCSTPHYRRCRRLPRLLVDQVVCSKPREQLVVKASPGR